MSTALVAEGVAGMKALVGQKAGPTTPLVVTQERIDRFAAATDDHQWIHVDVDRAAKESPFGSTIAHGYLTLALIPHFMPELLRHKGFRMGINYGTNKVRFPSPVPAGASVRASLEVNQVVDIAGGVEVVVTSTIAADTSQKPACVAVLVLRYYE